MMTKIFGANKTVDTKPPYEHMPKGYDETGSAFFVPENLREHYDKVRFIRDEYEGMYDLAKVHEKFLTFRQEKWDRQPKGISPRNQMEFASASGAFAFSPEHHPSKVPDAAADYHRAAHERKLEIAQTLARLSREAEVRRQLQACALCGDFHPSTKERQMVGLVQASRLCDGCDSTVKFEVSRREAVRHGERLDALLLR